MNAQETLKIAAQQLATEAELCQKDAELYLTFYKYLPRLFPCPNLVTTGDYISQGPEFVYDLEPDECAESLRFLLALTFATPSWFGEYKKTTNQFEVCSETLVGKYSVKLRICNAFTAYYNFAPKQSIGNTVLGVIHSRHFHSLRQSREDLVSTIFLEKGIESRARQPQILAAVKTLSDARKILDTMEDDNEKTTTGEMADTGCN